MRNLAAGPGAAHESQRRQMEAIATGKSLAAANPNLPRGVPDLFHDQLEYEKTVIIEALLVRTVGVVAAADNTGVANYCLDAGDL